MDRILQAAKIIWPQISESTKIISAREDTVIIPTLKGFSTEWYEEEQPQPIPPILSADLPFGQITLTPERYDGLDFAAAYNEKFDVLAVKAVENDSLENQS